VVTPFLLMGYYNPILAYGEEAYVRDAAAAGANGFIVPDLPPEESEALEAAAAASGMALIHFLAPTSNPRRIATVARRARGFIYIVSVTGVTGARRKVAAGLASFVSDVRRAATVPLAVGFGISTPEQAREVATFADGVIVGSALINATSGAENKVGAATSYVRTLREGLRSD
jgi:tryptophan synthase alpha chain